MIIEILNIKDKIELSVDNKVTTFNFIDKCTYMNNVKVTDKIDKKLAIEFFQSLNGNIPETVKTTLKMAHIEFLRIDTHKDTFILKTESSDESFNLDDNLLRMAVFHCLAKQLKERFEEC